ncbi:MAG: hypothetical protein KME11_15710 [Timaviella obliquedivisa GSE-PSE-MK23-08B]|jgi:hypothetical protein|nr:hypothetical protein [Timaviella obliquedivisa GSE-PSE-MK23-08B]
MPKGALLRRYRKGRSISEVTLVVSTKQRALSLVGLVLGGGGDRIGDRVAAQRVK